MNMKKTLRKIFKEESRWRVYMIYRALKKVSCKAKDDLKFLDEIVLENTKLTLIERKKLLSYTSDMRRSQSLGETLEKIFGVTNREKREKIKEYFEKNEIYTSEDLSIFNLDKIGNNSTIFTRQDVSKIKYWIRKEHPDIYEDSRKAKYLDSLYARRNALTENLVAVSMEIVARMKGHIEGSIGNGSYLSSMLLESLHAASNVFPFVGAIVESMDIGDESKRQEANFSFMRSMVEQLEDINKKMVEVDDEITRVLAVEGKDCEELENRIGFK